VKDALETATQLRVDVDGHRLLPAVTTFNGRGVTTVGTPAIDSNLARDVYVTFDAVGGNGNTSGAQVQNDLPSGSVVLGVTVEPLLAWLWLGGLIIGLGSAMTFFRRKYGDEVGP
jgi:cytochrome c-type biogenesis protein CcmF